MLEAVRMQHAIRDGDTGRLIVENAKNKLKGLIKCLRLLKQGQISNSDAVDQVFANVVTCGCLL